MVRGAVQDYTAAPLQYRRLDSLQGVPVRYRTWILINWRSLCSYQHAGAFLFYTAINTYILNTILRRQ